MSLITPPPIDIRLKKEQEETEIKGIAVLKARLYRIIKVARDEDLGEQIGKEIYFDLVNYDKVHTFSILKCMPFIQFKKEVAKAFGIPVQFQRYWLWGKRENHTYRPDRALTAQEEIQSVGQLREVSNENAELNLFLEVELCLDLRPFPPPDETKDDILLFLKLYDPLIEKIRYVGRLSVKGSGKPLEILSKLKELAGFSPDEEIELFEELQFEPNVMCEHIDSNMSFHFSGLLDGDIICFQKSVRNQCSEQYCFPEVPSFLEYVRNRQEQKEQKGKEKAEACLYTMIKVARDEDLGEQIGKEIYLDLVDHDKVSTFCIQNQMPFTQFKEEVAKAFGIPVQFQRYWLWAKRQNHTYRPDRALTAQEEIQSVGELREVSNKWNNAELKLFLEVELCLDLRPLYPPGKMIREEILLFFKLYDPLKEKIRFCYSQEIRFEPNVMCEHIDKKLSFRGCHVCGINCQKPLWDFLCICLCSRFPSIVVFLFLLLYLLAMIDFFLCTMPALQLEDGDIICFQKSLRNQGNEQYRFPEVPSFFKYVHNNRQVCAACPYCDVDPWSMIDMLRYCSRCC